jgi:polysaccharide export outer membrane protein
LLAGCTSALPAYTPQASPLPAYKLGPNDRVRVTVFGEDRLSGEFTVDSEGRIALPLIGEVAASGQSTTELSESIRARLAGRFILNPRVAVEVSAYRPYFIIGEVNEPGEYPYAAGLTLINAVAQAKGFTIRANKRAALVRRQGLDRTVRVDIGPQTFIAPGDVVTILERWF